MSTWKELGCGEVMLKYSWSGSVTQRESVGSGATKAQFQILLMPLEHVQTPWTSMSSSVNGVMRKHSQGSCEEHTYQVLNKCVYPSVLTIGQPGWPHPIKCQGVFKETLLCAFGKWKYSTFFCCYKEVFLLNSSIETMLMQTYTKNRAVRWHPL